MAGLMEMLRHMFGRRTVAAQRHAAGLAGTQVYPTSVYLYTFLTLIRFGSDDVSYFTDVFTNLICHYYSFKY